MIGDEWRIDHIRGFFAGLRRRRKSFAHFNEADFLSVLTFTCNLWEIPYPPKQLVKYFLIHPIISSLLFELARNLPREEFDELDPLLDSRHSKRPGPFVQLRELHANGSYPNIEFSRGNCHFIINHGYPYLITYNAGPGSHSASEVAWATKNEIRFAAAVSCASTKGYHSFIFGYPTGLELSYEYFSGVPHHQRHTFLIEWSRLHDSFDRSEGRYSRFVKPDFTVYQFTPFSEAIRDFNGLFDTIRISDNLMLRTLSYYVKSTMLWANPVFGEEASGNALFAIEGCLLLLQRKEGEQSRNINLQKLEAIFAKRFPRGEESFEYIRDAYDKRIELVHPAPKWGTDWSPYLQVDDVFDYQHTVKFLMNFILLDRVLEDI